MIVTVPGLVAVFVKSRLVIPKAVLELRKEAATRSLQEKISIWFVNKMRRVSSTSTLKTLDGT